MKLHSSETMAEKHEAPDGGWGWVIVAAFAISNIIVIPTMQGYALLYRNVFNDLQMSATDISTIINVNSAFGLVLGLFMGPLMKVFTFRQVAMAGSLLIFIGFALSSFATSFSEFIIYYGIINSSGFSTTLAAYGLALNTYFNRRRNLASGLCTAFTGLGPVFMPILISYLIDTYAVQGTALILSALILHSFAGALLLQPVRWHIKKPLDPIKEKELELLNPEVKCTRVSISIRGLDKLDEEDEKEDIDEYECQSVHGMENAVIIPTRANSESGGGGYYSSKVSLNEKAISPDSTWWKKESNTLPRTSRPSISIEKKKKSSLVNKIIEIFDFDLLKDGSYRIVWFGMSLAFTAEINFSLMTPVILGDKGMSIEQTARLMSSLATTDIVFRFISPFIGDFLKWTPKYMYMASLVCLVITRSSLTMVSGYNEIFISCLIIGVAKGLRTVYMALVIPSTVPLEKLASATGLQTLLNGIFLLVAGPALGYLRDTVGNYDACIHVINGFSVITIMLWTFELLLNCRKSKTNEKDNSEPEK